jgi:hypothetical protein
VPKERAVTTPSELPPRRRASGWGIVLAVGGASVAAAVAVRLAAGRRRPALPSSPRPDRLPPAVGRPAPEQPATSRSLFRMAVGAAVVVVLAVGVAVVTRPSGGGNRPGGVGGASVGGAMSLADCQAAVAARTSLPEEETCGYPRPAGMNPFAAGQAADPGDPRYAGAVLPVELSAGGAPCAAGAGRPLLRTVRPTLTAAFTPGTGPGLILSTFQITGLDHFTDRDLTADGSRESIDGRRASLYLWRYGDLRHGESYRWRVRATPSWVAADGWSPWCEFTVA